MLSNRFVCLGFVSLGLQVAFGPLSANYSLAVERPNFVFILADDLGWTDLGCYGSTFYETPNIDTLARGGMRFTQGYAACQVCSPSRASILLGPEALASVEILPAE